MATTFTIEFDWDRSGTWTNETGRCRRVKIRTGFEKPGDLVAAVGRCVLVMDNDDRRFSPGYSSSPLYGKLLPQREVRIKATSGTNTWTLFRGFIETITPDAGEWGAGECEIACVDGMAILARQRIGVVYHVDKAVDEAVSEVVSVAYTPAATSYSDNGDVLTHYGRSWLPEETTCWDALLEVCRAVYGRFFIARDGTATYLSRGDAQDPSVAAAATMGTSAVLDEMKVSVGIDQVVNLAQISVYPVESIGSNQVLWTAQSVLRLAPGEERIVYAPFHDEYGERVGASEIVPPAAHTDYEVFDDATGEGFDYTEDPAFSIEAEMEATRVKFTLGNSATGPLYVTLLQVRGKPILAYDPVVIEVADSASQSTYEVRAAALDLPMQSDPLFARSYGEYLVGRFKTPFLRVDRLCVRDIDLIGSVNVFSLDLMDKVIVSDSQSGASALQHWVIGAEYDLSATGFWAALHLERADERQYWLLGKEDFGELGSATRLGF